MKFWKGEEPSLEKPVREPRLQSPEQQDEAMAKMRHKALLASIDTYWAFAKYIRDYPANEDHEHYAMYNVQSHPHYYAKDEVGR